MTWPTSCATSSSAPTYDYTGQHCIVLYYLHMVIILSCWRPLPLPLTTDMEHGNTTTDNIATLPLGLPRTRWLKLNYPWVLTLAAMNERVTPLTRHKQTDKWTLSVMVTKEDWLYSSFNGFQCLAPGNHSNSFLTKSPISTRFACWLVATWLLFSQLNVPQNISAGPFHILQFQVCLAFCDNCRRKGWVGKGYQRENE